MAAVHSLPWSHAAPAVPLVDGTAAVGRHAARVLRRASHLARRLPWANLLAQVVFLTATAILFFPALTRGAVRWQDDTKYFYFPLLSDVAAALKQGRLPLWEPGIFGGYPLLADGESGMLYPAHLVLLRLLDPASALVALRFLRFYLAGAFTFAFLRATGAARTGAIVGGLVFMLSGFMVGQVVHENLDSGMVWLPLALCFAERAVRQTPATEDYRWRRYATAAFAGVALAMQALAVHVQVCVFSVLLVGPYVAWRVLFRDAVGTRLPGRLLIGAGIGLVMGTVAAGLSAVQMLPLLDAAARSARGNGISLTAATINSVTPFQLLTIVVPHLLKRPDGVALTYWVEWEVAIYVGLPALMLAVVAVALRRDRYTLFFGAAAVLSLALSTGRYGPHWVVLVTQDLLGEHGLRSPGRFAFLWCFSAAALAGLGADWLERARPLRALSRLWSVAVMGVLAGCSAAMLLAVRAAHVWLGAHPDATRAWLEQHYLRFDATPAARLKVTADDVYRGLVAALDPANPATAVWALSIVGGYALLVAWLVLRSGRAAVALRPLTVVVVGIPLLAAAAQAHPSAAAAAIEPNSAAARYLQAQLAPPGVPDDQRPLYRAYTSQPVYLGHTDVEPNVLLPLGVQEAGGYSSLSTTVNLAYGWGFETSMGRMLDVWNARYFLWPNAPDPLPSYELTSFHPLRPLLAGTGGNAGAAGAFRVSNVLGENVRVVATLRDAANVPEGTVVAWVTATDDQGETQRWPLRMGMEIADGTLPSGPADDDTGRPWPLPVFSWKEYGAGGKPFDVWLYYAKLPLDHPRTITRLAVQAVAVPGTQATLRLHGLGVGQPNWQVANVLWSDRERFTLVAQDEQIRVYRNETALPRAYLVPIAIRAPAAIHIKEMAERGFDPERLLLVDADGPLEAPADALGKAWVRPRGEPGAPAPDDRLVSADALGRVSTSPSGTTTIVQYGADRVVAQVEAADDAWLFLADTYDPSWRAYVDGVERPVRLANAMFRAVGVPAGRHTVEFRYQPAPLQRGAAITLATGLGLLLALAAKGLAWVWWQRPRTQIDR